MSETAELISSFSGLAVGIGALLVSVGVLILLSKLGDLFKSGG